MRSDRLRGMLLALGAAGLSGVAFFVNSYGVKRFGDATVYTTGKNAVAGLVLVAMTAPLIAGRARLRHKITLPRTRAQVLGLTALAVVGGSVPFVLFFEGYARIESGPVQAQFINKTLVVWVALLAVIVLRERIGPLQVGAVAVLVVGQAVLSGGGSSVMHISFGSGEAMILAATVLWAVEVVLAKTLLRSLSSWTVALARMLAGSVLLIAWVIVTGKAGVLVHMTADQWKWVLLTGALLAAYVATWLAALALAPAVAVTSVLVAAVPVTAVLQALVDHTPLRPQLNGLSLVVLGATLALVATLPRRRGERVTVGR
jgi:drug/metabolite transporter (DMT)-like permease